MNGKLVLTLPWHLLEAQDDIGHNQSRRFLELLEDNFLSQVLDKVARGDLADWQYEQWCTVAPLVSVTVK